MAELLQNEKIHVTVAGDTLILPGMLSDAVKADQALPAANAYVRRSARRTCAWHRTWRSSGGISAAAGGGRQD